MSTQNANNVRLGIFVLAGLTVLILSMYMIGKSQNLFGANFTLKARFKSASGLTSGNNVRFSGIDAGTVKTISIINDTTIEIALVINKKLQSFIAKNALAEIGNEGLMGNKVVNITPTDAPAPPVEDGDMLQSKQEVNTGTMLETFSRTNDNVEVISGDLKVALRRLNNSKPLWQLLEDTGLSRDISATLSNFRKSSASFNTTANDLHDLIDGIKHGEGVAGVLLADKKEAENLKETLHNIKHISENADKLTAKLDSIAAELQNDINSGHGTVHNLLKDRETADKIDQSLRNIQDGSAAFKKEMEALQQNHFIKKYMKKEAQQEKAQQQPAQK